MINIIGPIPARGVKDFDQLLTFQGKRGSVRRPQMSGKQAVTTRWVDSNYPVPMEATIEWSLSAGGR